MASRPHRLIARPALAAVLVAVLVAALASSLLFYRWERQRPAGPAVLGLAPVAFAAMPGWDADDLAEALPPFLASCAHLARMSAGATLGGAGQAAALGGRPADWAQSCAAAAAVPEGDPAAARTFFQAWFQPYAVSDAATGSPTGLFTGYYEPEFAGSRLPAPGFATPLYRRPGDLVRVDLGAFLPELKGRSIVGRVADGALIPYWDRAQIEAGALAGQHLELLYLAHPWDGFVLEIQGSGRIRLADGSVIRVSYDGQNGRAYVPIGRVLLQQGDIKKGHVSMQSIGGWLDAHPDQAKSIMDRNPSYVFFRELPDAPPDQGPPGALDVRLAPGRSIAVDRHFLPLGAPVFIDTTAPLDARPLRRLMQAQDVGGAIRGPVRADIFFGWGRQATAQAGNMQASGRDYLLLPKPHP